MKRKLRKTLILLFGISVLNFSCSDFGSAPETNRTTFIKVFEKGGNLNGQICEVVSDGFVLGANFTYDTANWAVVNKLDLHGNLIQQAEIYGSSVNSIKEIADGYLILGNRIETNDTALNINDRVVTKVMLTKYSADLKTKVGYVTYSDPANPTVDFQATGITIDGSGSIIIAGNKKGSQPTDLSKSFLVACNASLDTLWTRTFTLQDQDFTNAENVFVTPVGNVLWANSVQKINLSQTLSYLTNSLVAPELTFTNYSYYGQLLTKNRFVASEMNLGFATYGVVGTFSDSQGKSSNMFFIQADAQGNYIPSTLVILDGVNGVVTPANLDDTPTSESDDKGSAVCGTAENGFILGGSLTTTLKRGNGGLDIWLVKLDANGEVVWDKNFGGSGDDMVSSIRLLEDGGFLLCGTTVSGGLSSAFIMRIDSKGEILK